MGKRSGTLDHEADFLKASLAVLDREIARCEMRRELYTTNKHRKPMDSRIHWLRKLRTRHPEVGSD